MKRSNISAVQGQTELRLSTWLLLGSMVDNAKVLHYVGAGIAFPTSMLFVWLQTLLTYRLARVESEKRKKDKREKKEKNADPPTCQYIMAHLRLCMALLAFVALVLNIAFFLLESLALQLAFAIVEWVFCIIVMVFYATFAFEFSGISRVSMVMVSMGEGLRDIEMQPLRTKNPKNDPSNKPDN
ncbi:transmembrane protein 150A-like [Gouania willdenowi]|uniref:transmembrane protein 150A-like n=2 Tax=Gouania willdenowi TaxID=441366 RepID=UPI0010542F90|nr:transmembrane protein 150A-like [Gouania willdenowi]